MHYEFKLPDLGAGIFILILWEVFWKGIGLWKAVKKGDTIWFVAMFLINFFGIIPIFYLWRTKQLEVVLEDIKQFFRQRFHK